jgi:endonuclease/exonuclease/phosphatase family metal-dependent hydrolase
MLSVRRASLLLLLASAFACAAPVDDAATDDDEFTSGGPLRIATYNAGLVRGGVALADERLPLIAPALEATNADVLCLQEVWADGDVATLQRALEKTYPHMLRERTVETGSSWFECNALRLLSLNNCVSSQCAPNGTSAEECVQTSCKDAYANVSDDCKRCLAANTDKPSRCAFWSNDFVQGGRNGVVLFSRHPIENGRFDHYGTTLVHRGQLRARIKGKEISCTHLTSDLTTVPYPPGREHKSWVEEQTAEVARVADSMPASGCRIVAGDLNSSPDAPPLSPEVPSTLKAFAARGYTSQWKDPVCTWCAPPENPLASGRTNQLYDHILTNGCGEGITYHRIMDKPVRVTHDGQTIETRLSDHYGIVADLP